MKKTLGEKIIKNINNYLKREGISVCELADFSGIKYNSLWNILNRNKTIRLEDYTAICKALNEPLDFFIPNEKEISEYKKEGR